ncbi:RNA-directed RNA polymerase [ssRNA phage SRR5467091_6]|uniref:RNA-directed RNA polymerase n=1 Tax=ssRNA phage SRR5467091_6 TaxID=2786471 RepID=A0A8S5L017_9VIRU|nr:RNA-directed RNA polymerase [ssRNA phage SRR5467091_6]DAD50912.1 TPA_asm: RNA-directed RNA polymerase [ssRNA phage SRR5467091_6]
MSIISTWDGLLSTEATNEILSDLALRHLGEVGHLPDREYLVNCIVNGDFPALCNHDLDVSGLLPLDAYHLGQVTAFFRKRVDLDLGIDKELVAFEKFMETERTCARTNRDLRLYAEGRFQFYPKVEAALLAARHKVAEVLGDCPSLDELRLRFGPGATTQIQKRAACAKVKLSQKPACSEDLLPILGNVLDGMPLYTERWETQNSEGLYMVDCEVHHGRLSFVPKSAKTHRGIVVEPWLNSICQLGIGDVIAKRLRLIGIDIRDQTRNQQLAREGSVTGALATLDLSSASDTIADSLVAELLPPDWLSLLTLCRTSTVEYKGRVFRLEKFSSMGNGFTFPLETLIFWALTSSCCPKGSTVSVYGDDIICPTKYVEDVIQVLTHLGFSINMQKSFWTGKFRESCGTDWISGIDIRPLFITGPLSGHGLFRLHNFYVRQGAFDFAESILRMIPDHLVVLGPDGYGDGHLITSPGYILGDWVRNVHKKHKTHGYGGAIFDTWVYSKREFRCRVPGDRLLPAYSIYLREETVEDGVLESSFIQDREMRAWLNSQDPDRMPSFYESLGTRFLKDGTPVQFLPGTKGCKRISVYTLAT